MTKSLLLVAITSVFLLSGCQSTKYEWNNYSDHMYDYYSEKIDDQTYMDFLLSAEKQAKNSNKKLGPGMYAEIGTMYMRMGKRDTAIQYYKQEAEAWPESKEFMTALVEGISRIHSPRESAGAEASQGEQK